MTVESSSSLVVSVDPSLKKLRVEGLSSRRTGATGVTAEGVSKAAEPSLLPWEVSCASSLRPWYICR